ncbi:MAG: hypothetical protein JSR77_10090 [Planctomycetes bacterium]|nr:hypothetical protein [Planctomycetota bacterium]
MFRRFVFVSALTLATHALAQGSFTGFTYQGELRSSDVAASGQYDMRFELLNLTTPASSPPPLCIDNVQVTEGRFAVQLNYPVSLPATFAGANLSLRISVRADTGAGCSNTAGFTTLAPDQPITFTPYAAFAVSASSATNAINLNGQPASFYTTAGNLTGTLADARLSANVPRLNAAPTFTANVTAPTFIGALNGNASSATNLNGQPASFYLNAANLTGALADARLSSNVALRNAANTFAQPQTITTPITTADALTINHVVDLSATEPAGIRSSVNWNGSGRGYGGFFDCDNSPSGVGVYAQANAATGPTRALWAKALSFTGHAGYFEGRGYFSSNLGIGTTSPSAPLHVREGVATGAVATPNASAVFERDTANYLQLLTPDASEKGVMFGSPSSGFFAGMYYVLGQSLNFRTGGNLIRMRITDAGDVGVNVTTPAARLDVGGDIKTNTRVLAPAYANAAGQFVAPVAVASFDQFGSPIGVPTGNASLSAGGTGIWNISFDGYSNANFYSVIITSRGTTPIVGSQISQSASSIAIRTFNLAGTLTSAPFNIVVYRLN